MTETLLAVKITALVLLVAASAFFSGSETALFSLDPLQLRSLGARKGAAARIATMMATPRHLLSTLLIGNTLVNVVIAAIAYSIVRAVPAVASCASLVSIAASTAILLLFGEIAPKRVAIRFPLEIARLAAAPVCLLHAAFAPIRRLLEFLPEHIAPFREPERKSLSDDELVTAIDLSNEQGTLDAYERRLASGIMQLSSMSAADVMTPRVDISGIDLDEAPSTYPALIRSTPFRNLPVYENSPDSINAFLDVRAYLLDPGHDFDAALSKPVFVPETATLDDILVTMQRSRRHIVCVIDEYGGVAGLVTRGDILEVLTGPLAENSDTPPRDPIEKIGDATWRIDGDASLELVNRAIGTELEAEGADRLSGWIAAQAGRFLRTGESVTAQGCTVRVTRHRKLRILDAELELEPGYGAESGQPRDGGGTHGGATAHDGIGAGVAQ